MEIIEYVDVAKPHSTMWWDRADPFFELPYQGALVDSQWEMISATTHRPVARPDGVMQIQPIQVSAPIMPGVTNAAFDPLIVRAMAMFHAWQHLTTAQISALLDIDIAEAHDLCRRCYTMGLLKRFTPATNYPVSNDSLGYAWSLMRESWAWSYWLSQLPPLQRALVGQGNDPLRYAAGSSSLSSLRHNLLMADIMIRSFEVMPHVVGWWGDRWATGSSLVSVALESEQNISLTRPSMGDSAMVLADGSLVIFELVGSYLSAREAREKMSERVMGWAKVIALSSLDVKVVFIHSSAKVEQDRVRFREMIENGIDMAQSVYVTAYQEKKMRDNIFRVDCRKWFPSPRTISQSFVTMDAINVSSGEEHSIVSDVTIDADNPIVANTVAALHTPLWLTTPFQNLNNFPQH